MRKYLDLLINLRLKIQVDIYKRLNITGLIKLILIIFEYIYIYI